MKKIIITLSFVFAMLFNVTAQDNGVYSYDGFFSASESSAMRNTSNTFSTPSVPGMGEFGDQDGDTTPLGSGLLILAGLGVAYAARRKQ